MKTLVSILFALLIASNAHAVVIVDDQTGMLNLQHTQQLTNQLLSIQNQSDTLIQATLIDKLNGVTIEDKAYTLRRVLEDVNPNVIVMLVAWGDRKAYIATSSSVRNKLSDTNIEQIFKNHLVPSLKRNDIIGGFSATARAINEQLTSNHLTAVSPIDTNVVTQSTESSNLVWLFILIPTFVIAIVLITRSIRSKRKTHTYGSYSWDKSYVPAYTSSTVKSRYKRKHHDNPSAVRQSSGDTNVFAPIIVDNSTSYSSPSSSSSKSSSSDWSSSSSGGGYGGSYDSGGGGGGGFDGGGGGGGDF